ncbi:cuticle protein [Holotrichia oblita]|uniref:Cuticle protein n=1 Tax=Holotrichia oblita TaxID=644536 RepID=A0ACB9TTY9_HOLOL|nr:cuticle protein [Holotrichia oblita]
MIKEVLRKVLIAFFVATCTFASPIKDEAVVDVIQDTEGYYKYTFTSKNITREEERTHDGLVKGYYSFLDDNGDRQTIHYTAGDNGFAAEGSSIPVDLPEVAEARKQHESLFALVIACAAALPIHDEAVVDVVQGTDGYYKYTLKSKYITREEERHADGSVNGYFSYIDKDGKKQVIHYTSGPRGYIAEGPSVPADLPEVAQARAEHQAISDKLRSLLPALKSDNLVDEVPEVPLSKEEFLHAVSAILHPSLPVALHETPEVEEAKKEFFKTFSTAL